MLVDDKETKKEKFVNSYCNTLTVFVRVKYWSRLLSLCLILSLCALVVTITVTFLGLKKPPQYGIPVLMTDKRVSQVSHSLWRTRASHNKSRLILGPQHKGRQSAERSLQMQVITAKTLTLLQCHLNFGPTEKQSWAIFLHLIWGNQRLFSPIHFFQPPAQVCSFTLPFFS